MPKVISEVEAGSCREQGTRFRVRQQDKIQIPDLILPAYMTYSSCTLFTDFTVFCCLESEFNEASDIQMVQLLKTLNSDTQKALSKH